MARRRLTPAQPGYLGPAVPPRNGPEATIAPIAQVSGQSAEAAALREMAQGLQAARDEGRMIVEVPLSDVASGHLLRDRVALDREELEILKASIGLYGQRVPAEITPLAASEQGAPAHRFGLISGWRRLTALNELHRESGEARFSTLKALIRPAEEAADSYVAMVEENEIRIGLSYYERARLVAEVTARGVFEDHASALRHLFAAASRAKRSKIASFIDIHTQLGDLLQFPTAIPERLGLAVVAQMRSADVAPIRARLEACPPETPEAEVRLLESCLDSEAKPVSRAKRSSEVLRPGLTVTTTVKGRSLVISLSGEQVDNQLLAKLRDYLL